VSFAITLADAKVTARNKGVIIFNIPITVLTIIISSNKKHPAIPTECFLQHLDKHINAQELHLPRLVLSIELHNYQHL